MTSAAVVTVFAPARVDLSAGFGDVEPLCLATPARVLNVTLDKGVQVSVGSAAQGQVPAPGGFVDRLCAEIVRKLGIDPPVVRIGEQQLPFGGGLGVSGALSVALTCAVSMWAGASPMTPEDLVSLACTAERDIGLTGGTQDQLASVHGGAGLVRRHDDLGSRTRVDADLAALGDRVVLVHGHGERNSGSIIDQVLHAPRSGVLRTVAAMNALGETMAQALRDGALDDMARLMNESTKRMRDLHREITGDDTHRNLRMLGAQGAKPCGAGGPGTVWAALVAPDRRRAFADGAVAAGWSVLQTVPAPGGAAAS